MSPQDLKVGCAYYRMTYPDSALTIPGVKPMIYIGTNIPDDNIPETVIHYFQDTTSHSWRGPVTDDEHCSKHPEIEAALFPHGELDVQREVFTLAEVIVKLMESQRRSQDPRQ